MPVETNWTAELAALKNHMLADIGKELLCSNRLELDACESWYEL